MKNIIVTKKVDTVEGGGFKIISARISKEIVDSLDELSEKTNRSRSELINILLKTALENVSVQDG